MKREYYYDIETCEMCPMPLTLCYHKKDNTDFLLFVLACEIGKENDIITEIEMINTTHANNYHGLIIPWEKYDIEYVYVIQQEPVW